MSIHSELPAAYLPTICTALLLFISSQTLAQGIFQVSADLRARSEYRHGFQFPLDESQRAGFFIDQRSRLIFDYSQDKFILKLSVQDIRVWGNQPQLVRNDGALTALHEGWGQVFFTDALSLKVGRQEINLDDQRIFGAVDWQMPARAHDAAMLKYKSPSTEVQATFAFNQDGIQNTTTYYNVANNYKAMQYLWGHHNFGLFNASFLFLNHGKQGGTPDDYRTYYSQTVGPRLGFGNERIKSFLTYYGQFGREADATTDIRAHYLAFDMAYKLTPQWTVTPGFEYLSGNDQDGPSGVNEAFAPFYGTNHKFNGLMDYFYVGNHFNSVGLTDIFAMLDYRQKRFSGSLRLHYFRSPGKVFSLENPLREMDRNLGIETDLVLQYRFSDQVTFDAGYSRMFPTDTMIRVKGTGSSSEGQHWAWLMIAFKPVFYKTPEKPAE